MSFNDQDVRLRNNNKVDCDSILYLQCIQIFCQCYQILRQKVNVIPSILKKKDIATKHSYLRMMSIFKLKLNKTKYYHCRQG